MPPPNSFRHFSQSTNLRCVSPLCLFTVQYGSLSALHLLGKINIELPGTEESQLHTKSQLVYSSSSSGVFSYQRQGIKSFRVSLLLEHHPQLRHLCLLLFRQMPRMTRLVCRTNRREVIIIVLRVGVEFGHCGGDVKEKGR